MKKAIAVLIIFLFAACSGTEDSDPLTGRWAFTGTDAADIEKIASNYEQSYNVNGFKQVFAASKLILREDKTFDLCLFQNYRHGTWSLAPGKLLLRAEPQNIPFYFSIDTIGNRFMQLRIDSSNFKQLGRFVMPYARISFFKDKDEVAFRYEPDQDSYDSEAKDPYSRENNWWRIKPLQPESTEQLKKRVLNLVDFHLLMFHDAIDNDKSVITYNWFTSPLVVAKNGIALSSYRKIKQEWEGCFYDSTQAMYGFYILRSGFEKRMKFPDDIENPFERNIEMLRQYRKNIE